MAENSKIEWTHHTFNMWRGCQKVAPECLHCYAESLSKRNPGTLGTWGPKGERVIASASYWRQPIKWNRDAEQAGERRRVFCASLADVFEDRPDLVAPRARLFELIDATPHLDWLLLTKRPQNIRRLWVGGYRSNVWRGTSAGSQPSADEFLYDLVMTGDLSPISFLSCEPMIGPVDLAAALGDLAWKRTNGLIVRKDGNQRGVLHWVICGGESGPGARPMNPNWVRRLRDQCAEVGIAFFFKQWGEWGYHQGRHHTDSMDPFKVGKKAAGRILDGCMWDEYPAVVEPVA